ncbi:hypothetical protein BJY52DRAFT_1117175 [Lactarius psammicola]|nr:hypothetical protein BJY52DRAFT_1117175 [Lactarius psammicola]
MSTSTTLVLNCLLLGQGRDKIFPVEISGNKSVGSLRKVIKDERKRTLQFFEASDLKLWNVDVAVGEHFGEEEIEGLGLERKKSLGSMEKLSAIFSGKFTDGNLHIVVRHEREPVQLNLNCLVLSEKRNHIFLVEILSTQTVAALRNVIKDKKKAFHHVDTRTIILWRVSIPNDDSLELKLSRLNLVDEDSLSPTQELSEVYSNPPIRKHVHVIVKPPPAREFERLALATRLTSLSLL